MKVKITRNGWLHQKEDKKVALKVIHDATYLNMLPVKEDTTWFEDKTDLIKEVAESPMPKRKPSESLLDYLDRISNDNF